MLRLSILAGLAALSFGATFASAQEAGGVMLSPEVMQADNAQGRVLDHVFARAQQLQQLRLLNLTGGVVGSSNLANPGVTNGDPQTLGAGQTDPLSLASAMRQRGVRPSDPSFQQIVNNSQSLTLNAPNSSVNIGDNNIVRQQVSTSTAISPTGNASASAGAAKPKGRSREGKDKTKSNQTATSDATSVGGTAQAVAINTEVITKGSP
jgi:hypothetical protein